MDIALAVGSSVLSSFLQVLFDRMASPDFLDLFRERKQDGPLLKKLKTKLQVIRAVLDDAENKQITNPDVKEWLDELHDAVYKADDLLDEINTEALRLKVEAEYQRSTNCQVSSSPETPQLTNKFLDEMMPRIAEMVETLDEFGSQIQLLGLKKGGSKIQQSRLESSSLVGDVPVYGRDADKERIIQLLLSDGENGNDINVISIVGLGGIGKTTLAQVVYNDERVTSQFDTQAWVCISDAYDAVRITKGLLRELKISCSDSEDNFNSLQVQLQRRLAEKKFLLVLDDLWNENYGDWCELKKPFHGGKRGSKIIVTTRDERIPRMIKNGSTHSLDFIKEEDCWSLFKEHAFGNGGITSNSELEAIGKDIVKKCNGLPLAVQTLGGLLRSKSTVEEWDNILKSDVWNQSENQNDVLPELRLSYNHLPSHLKRCFTCCAVFPKDFQFKRKEVIWLWMANDLLRSSRKDKRIEDIGNEYFDELRSRSLFQQSKGWADYFSMHDLVNDLAQSTAHFVGHDTMSGGQDTSRLRHFSYFSSRWDAFKKFEHLKGAKCLRTFFSHRHYPKAGANLSDKFLHDILPSFVSLRDLTLFNYSSITDLPDCMGNLRRLRSLDLSFTKIEKLPSWICTFYNLQIFLLNFCDKLNELPRDIGKLINLRHLDVTETRLTEMPVQIGRLKNLQFLSTFIVSKDCGLRIEELGNLCRLSGKISILGLENVTDSRDATKANMKGKERITELSLIWGGDTNDSKIAKDVLDNLQPHSKIESVTIEGYGGTSFPAWVGDSSFGHMKSLVLEKCENCFCLPSLGLLPSLERLEIAGMSQISELGEDIYGKCSVIKPFRSLRVLRIQRMEELEKWHVPAENGVFSGLEELYIIDCPKLIEEFPQQLPALRKLEVSGCSRLVTPDCVGMTIIRHFSSLKDLTIRQLKNWEGLSSHDLENLTSLETLGIRDCPHVVSMPITGLPAALKRLDIGKCQNLELQTEGEKTGSFHTLIEELDIFSSLKDKDMRLGLFPKVKNLSIRGSWNLEVLSAPLGYPLTSLRDLVIVDCDNLMSFPEGGLSAPNLNSLSLRYCRNLKSLPERMPVLLPSLQSLWISVCPEIECFPEEGLPRDLGSPTISPSKKLWSCRRDWGLEKLTSLVELSVSVTRELESTLFPAEDWLLPCSLRDIVVWEGPNLKMLNYRGLQDLASLQELTIFDCPNLSSLPEEGLPPSLSLLKIEKCPLLKPRLQWEKGEDWPKVAHIPTIILDSRLIP